MSRRVSALTLVPTLGALIIGGTLSARATPPAPVVVPQQTTTTAPNLLNQLLQGLLPTTTTVAPPPAEPASGPAEQGTSAGQGAGGASPTTTASTTERTIPASALPIINSVLRTGSNNSNALLAALKPLTDQGMSQEEAALVGFGQFPVAGEAYWSDDWYNPRFTPEFHLHQGTDIFAARGTPVRAPVDGRVEFASEGAGGLAAYVTGADRTYYYMAHLDRFPTNIRSGQTVKQGTVVGFVGSTGNAEGGSPHVHFEIHPGGGAPVNPKPTLDKWVKDAIEQTKVVLRSFKVGLPVGLPRPFTQAGMLRRLDTGSLGGPTASDGPQLWSSNARRDANGVRLTAGGESRTASATWSPGMAEAQAKELEWLRANQLAADLLAPLTPRVLQRA